MWYFIYNILFIMRATITFSLHEIFLLCVYYSNLVQQIYDKNQTKGSVSDKSTKLSRKLAEMILFKISYGPKLNKSKMAVIFKMAAKLKKNYKIVL